MHGVQSDTRSAESPLLCRHCGYDLRTIDIEDRCPECGTAVASSLASAYLAGAEPSWLKQVYIGQRDVVLGVVLLVIGVPVTLIIDTWLDDFLDTNRTIRVLLGSLPTLLFLALLFVDSLRLTTRDPRLGDTESPVAPRRLALLSVSAAIPISLLYYGYLITPTPPVVSMLFLYAFGLTVCATIATLTLHLAHLAMRLPDAALGARCRSAATWFGIPMAMALLASAVQATIGTVTLLRFAQVVATLVAVVFAVKLFLCWVAFRRALASIIASSAPSPG